MCTMPKRKTCVCDGFQEQYFSGDPANIVIDIRRKYTSNTARCLSCGRVFKVAPKVARCLDDSQQRLNLGIYSG